MELEKYDINELQALIDTGVSDMPEKAVQLLTMLDTVRGLFQKYKSKTFIVNLLVKNFGISRQYAGRVFVDALNFFYLDHGISKEAWRNIYAEKLDNAATLCWETNDMEGYRRNIMSAAELRGLNKEDPAKVPEELFDRRPIIYINDPKRLGIPEISRTDLAAFIDKQDVSELEKKKLYQDVGVTDIEFEEDAKD